MISQDAQAAFCPVVLMPTFNNDGTLERVMSSVAALNLPIMVVNDGSTDGTKVILERWQGRALVLHHESNRGKAAALRTGFAAAHEQGFTHAATFDTDGQLDPADLSVLLERARANPMALVLGSRAWAIENYPPNNVLARRLSNAGIRLQCGANVADSQCGLRVYPVELMSRIGVRSGRYSFEAEAIARAVWAGCSIEEVAIRCTYAPAGMRVSHYVPERDTPRAIVTHLTMLVRSLVPWPRAKWPG